MRQLLILYSVILCSGMVLGQNGHETPSGVLNTNARLTTFGIRYPTGVNGEVSKSFETDYQISRRLHIQLSEFYDKFGTHEQINASFVLKWYIKKKLYLFAGPETVYDINQFSGEPELMRVNLNIGFGYEVNPNLLLELGYHPQINTTEISPNIKPAKQNTISLRARF